MRSPALALHHSASASLLGCPASPRDHHDLPEHGESTVHLHGTRSPRSMEQTFRGTFQTRRRRGRCAQARKRRAGASARACHPPARPYVLVVLSPGHARRRGWKKWI